MEKAPTKNGASKKPKFDASQSHEKEWSPGAYGSQEYWEERYKKHRTRKEKTGESDSSGSDSEGALAYHPWYFTYQELSPLILPLILGGREEDADPTGGCSKEDDEINEIVQEDNEKQQDTDGKPESINGNTETEQSIPEADDGEESDHTTEDVDNEEEEEELEEREGLAKNGPISVIEVGCGDMPLGGDLAKQLAKLEETTGTKADNIVKKIVCCDYSSTVINLCKVNQLRDIESSNGSSPNGSKKSGVAVDYVTADARKLPYPDCSFHLILEKGTLDAMLSDKETGASNCRLIMTDCARILKEGGYILLVSHLNAHTNNGIDWLNSVVVTGLRNGGGKSSEWEIEVHGSDGIATEECNDEVIGIRDPVELEDDDDSDEEGGEVEITDRAVSETAEGEDGDEAGEASDGEPPSGGLGPAVYIIHNLSKSKDTESKEDDDPPTVPLKFYSY